MQTGSHVVQDLRIKSCTSWVLFCLTPAHKQGTQPTTGCKIKATAKSRGRQISTNFPQPDPKQSMPCSLREAGPQPSRGGLWFGEVTSIPAVHTPRATTGAAPCQCRDLGKTPDKAQQGLCQQRPWQAAWDIAACLLPYLTLISVPHLISGALCSGNLSWKCLSACMTADVHST